ncbi:Cthe_2314 family HEPN domain-containing protein [Clostridium estertheticum]|uniref:Cthe-2314-like HEPN domain-containing protein n=1 Tax=Clostridium estertheticum subsp. estertheticum TaxID=1552 RepID=A0A1J0GNB4_9CLOT|nr:Cthe_2314 family HEPN domain-containing protein [Clostridium estertheticum]APC42827.1 hypothetical protein A7L45_22065 [Clostridium estertheticum subsp. estertheticum]
MDYRIDKAFDLLTENEWTKYLEVKLFEGMKIDIQMFSVSKGFHSELVFSQNIGSYINMHNNKVGTLNISYALCKHYFDKGIPDNPYYISPGKHGESVEYMPLFKENDWLTRYWFNYFAEAIYLKLFAIWDSIIGFLNEYYGFDEEQRIGMRGKVLKKTKIIRQDISKYIGHISHDDIYEKANLYRNSFVHSSTPNEISGALNIERNVQTEIIDKNSDGTIKMTEDGNVVMKKVKAAVNLSMGVGNYVDCESIMNNIEDFSIFTGNEITNILKMISEDIYKFDIFK